MQMRITGHKGSFRVINRSQGSEWKLRNCHWGDAVNLQNFGMAARKYECDGDIVGGYRYGAKQSKSLGWPGGVEAEHGPWEWDEQGVRRREE